MENTTIYQAGPSDYLEIITVWEASVRATHDFLTEVDIQAYKSLILNSYLDLVRLFCTKEYGRITGFLGLSDDTIQMLFIAPNMRGKGVGKQLLNYAILKKGIRKVDVNEQNPQAIGFYQHMGFSIVGRSEVDGQGRPFPLLHMKLQAS